MQLSPLDYHSLHEFYSQIILPHFGVSRQHILWQEDRILGPDNEAHVFLTDDAKMVLVYDDYPTTTLADIRKSFDDDTAVVLQLSTPSDGVIAINNAHETKDVAAYTLSFGSATHRVHTHNVTGYFRLFRLSASRREVLQERHGAKQVARSQEATIYNGLIAMGHEIIAIARLSETSLSSVENIAAAAQSIAFVHDFGSLADFFFDVAEESDSYEDIYGETKDQFLERLRHTLEKVAREAKIHPSVTADEKRVLDTRALPIHTKMMQNPARSPEYFVELIKVLDECVRNEKMSSTAAAQEITYALDRPEIIASIWLSKAVDLAYQLDLPSSFASENNKEKWQRFAKCVVDSTRSS